MDLSSLRETVANISLYDIKAGVRKVQNAVMNYTEMEAKVREATNNEPWGASSSLMQEIANGTFSYQTLNEIMPMIYRRFTEKSAEEWRQIYKALQLLEFLIKHGSERVIDDVRSHLTLLKMLRQFHYIDQNGKDQGINVRNRAKELSELLGDVERIRAERKKARAIKGKFVGVEGGTGLGFSSGSGGRFGGFGSNSMGGGGGGSSSGRTYGGFSGGVYGDGGGFGGETDDWRSPGAGSGGRSSDDQFEEYDEFDEGDRPAVGSSSRRADKAPASAAPANKTEPSKVKQPEVDLFSFDDPVPSTAPVAVPSNPALASLSGPSVGGGGVDDDEFDDFQSAAPEPQVASQPLSAASLMMGLTSNTTTFASPQPVSAPAQANLNSMVNLSSISPAPSSSSTPGPNYSAFSIPAVPATTPATSTNAAAPGAPRQPVLTQYQPTGPNYFQSVSTLQAQPQPAKEPQSASLFNTTSSSTMASIRPVASKSSTSTPSAAISGNDAFGALWASVGAKKPSTPASTGPTMGQLAKEKSSAGIWGAPPPASGGFESAGGDLLG